MQWYALRDETAFAEPIPTAVVELAGDPVADLVPEPRPTAPPPGLTPVPDVVLDISKMTQLTLDL